MSNLTPTSEAPPPTHTRNEVSRSSFAPTLRQSTSSLVLDDNALDRMMRLAADMATARATIPVAYRNSPGDCLAVVMQAMQWKMNPYAVAQKTHFVNGTIGYEAQLVNAVVTESGAIEGGFDYEWFGPWENVIGKYVEKQNAKGETYRKLSSTLADEKGVGIKVTAVRSVDHATKTLELLLCQAGVRNSTLWADDPRQQLAYLAVKRWARLYTPGVMMGVYTPDELELGGGERFMGAADVVVEESKVTTKSRTQTIKEKVKDSKTKPPLLAEVVGAILAADTPETMRAARGLAEKLESDADKDIARARYSKRLADLKGSDADQDPAPTTSAAAQDDDESPTFAIVADRLTKAAAEGNLDVLDLARDYIPAVKDPGQREELDAIYTTLREQLLAHK